MSGLTGRVDLSKIDKGGVTTDPTMVSIAAAAGPIETAISVVSNLSEAIGNKNQEIADGAASKTVETENVGTKLPDDRIIGSSARRGNAPIGDDGFPVERHHNGQQADSIKDEMTRTDHRLGDNFSKNHSNTGQNSSNIDRATDRAENRDYWNQEWDDGRFDRFNK